MEQTEQPKRLTTLLQEVIDDICDHYCRYNFEAQTYKTDEEMEALWKRCANCPFTTKL